MKMKMKKDTKPMKKDVGVKTMKKKPQKLKEGGMVKKKPQYM